MNLFCISDEGIVMCRHWLNNLYKLSIIPLWYLIFHINCVDFRANRTYKLKRYNVALRKDVISKKSKSKKINEVNYIVFNTEMFLKKIKAPQCPNCKKCPAREKCKYKLWKKINNILVQKYSDYIKNKKEF